MTSLYPDREDETAATQARSMIHIMVTGLVIAMEYGRGAERCLCSCSIVRVLARRTLEESVQARPPKLITKLFSAHVKWPSYTATSARLLPSIDITAWTATTKTTKAVLGMTSMFFHHLDAPETMRVSIYNHSHSKESP
jgi:hypothetical protein